MEVSKGDFLITDGGYIKCVVSNENLDIKFDDGSSIGASELDGFRMLYKGRGFVESEWSVKQCCNFITSAAQFSTKLLEETNNICFEICSLLNDMDFTAPFFREKIPSLANKLNSLGLMSVAVLHVASSKLGEIPAMAEQNPTAGNAVLLVVAGETIEAIDATVKSVTTIVDLASEFDADE